MEPLTKQNYEPLYPVQHTVGSREDIDSASSKWVLEIERIYRILTNWLNFMIDHINDLRNEVNILKQQIKDIISGVTPVGRTKGALRIQRNGSDLLSSPFNGSADQTANITVPTKLSDLIDDIGAGGGGGTTPPPTPTPAAGLEVLAAGLHMGDAPKIPGLGKTCCTINTPAGYTTDTCFLIASPIRITSKGTAMDFNVEAWGSYWNVKSLYGTGIGSGEHDDPSSFAPVMYIIVKK